MSEEYPNDKETQEWMNASLGTPVSNPLSHEEQVRFWSDKYDEKVDQFYELCKSFDALHKRCQKAEFELHELAYALRAIRPILLNYMSKDSVAIELIDKKLELVSPECSICRKRHPDDDRHPCE